MKITTARFGELVIEQDDMIEFDLGLLAFEDCTRYVLFDITENADFKWLQSIDNPQLAFLVVDPFAIKKDYYVDLNDELAEQLQILNPEDVVIYTVVTVPPTGLKDATTNLVGPLVINWRVKKAKQIICEDNNNTIKHPLLNNDYLKLSYGG